MNFKLLLSTIITGVLLTCNVSAATASYKSKALIQSKCSSNKAMQLKSVVISAPWADDMEPSPLPKHWQKHKAKLNIVVYYNGIELRIPEGDTYFTYKGKVAIGFHGTYNPPRDMS
ncbi:MAG: hypothetical protein H0T62_06885 [Parachlamydiaceae bacterium]|nr:hypothetical protein [Parachlamydiaceae bacterium]